MKIGQMKHYQTPTIYKRAQTGGVLFWFAEILGHKRRSVSGVTGGTRKLAEWTECFGVNVGKSNETTPEEQAIAECKASMDKKLKNGGYHTSLAAIDEAAEYNVPMKGEEYDPDVTELPKEFDLDSKLNGFRSLHDATVSSTSGGEPIVSCLHIRAALARVFKRWPGIVVDGEAYNHTHRELLNRIGSLVRKQTPSAEEIAEAGRIVQLHVYDAYIKGQNTVTQEYRDKLVDMVVAEANSPCIIKVWRRRCTKATLEPMYKEILRMGYEGAMIRWLSLPYKFGRSRIMLKYKPRKDAEFTILEVREGKGKRAGMAAKILCRLPCIGSRTPRIAAGSYVAHLRVIGQRPSFETNVRWTDEEKQRLWSIRDELVGKQITVSFAYYTEFGVPFHAYSEKIWEEGNKI